MIESGYFINIFNVGHGQCVLLRNDSSNYLSIDHYYRYTAYQVYQHLFIQNKPLLIDFGTLSSDYYESQAKWDESCLALVLFGYLSRADSLAVVSHLHQDHISGFEKLLKIQQNKKRKPLFREIYAPWINFEEALGEYLVIMSMFILEIYGGAVAPQEALMAKMAKDFLTENVYLGKLAQNGLEYVIKGDTIKALNREFKVIWPLPSFKSTVNAVSIAKKVKASIEKLEKKYPEHTKNVKKDAKEVIENMIKIYGKRKENENRTYPSEVSARKDEQKQTFNIKEIEGYLGKIREDKKSNKIVKELFIVFRNLLNDLSIILHLPNEVLFPGDASENCIKTALNLSNNLSNKQLKEYLIVLTPHHGTKWPQSTIKPKILVNSCGYCRSNYKGPTDLISKDLKKSKIPTQIYCTDGHKNCSIKPKKIYCLSSNSILTFLIAKIRGKEKPICIELGNARKCTYFKETILQKFYSIYSRIKIPMKHSK
nr:hypothetical protein [Candidatus Freyarchaeota archaeon]